MRFLWIALCILLGLVALWVLGPREDSDYGYHFEQAAVLAKTGSLGSGSDGSLPSFGVLGDSNSDEYRADDDRGSEPWKETTLNFVELLARHRGLDFGPWGARAEPRRTGYEYNWSRSGATASSMIEGGQHTGLAAQIQSGDVSYAFIWIGTNDFGPGRSTPYSYDAIYSGEVGGEQLEALLDGFVALVGTAIDTLLGAGPEGLVVVPMVDYGFYPPIVQSYPEPVGRQRFTDAMDYVNTGLASLVKEHPNATMASYDELVEIVTEAYLDGFLYVDDVSIDMTNAGDAPTHFVLNDTHIGTVANGLVANRLFLPSFNEDWELDIAPFSDEELLVTAGISPPVSASPPASEAVFDLKGYPNPTSETLHLTFTLARPAATTLRVFDAGGRRLATPISRMLPAGFHTTTLDVSGWRAGTYTYRLRSGDISESGRSSVVR